VSLPRFLVPTERLRASPVEITGPELNHIRVRRIGIGATVVLFDGKGQMSLAELACIDRRRAVFHLHSTTTSTRSDRPPLVLAIALLKGTRMDLVVEKATELGVDEIRPYVAERSVRPSVSSERQERWRRIAESAAKQCQRLHLPNIDSTRRYEDILATTKESVRLILTEPELRPRESGFDLLTIANNQSTIVLIGPEGGHTPTTLSLASHAGFTPVSLGDATLRSETAAIAILAVLNYLRTRNSTVACGG